MRIIELRPKPGFKLFLRYHNGVSGEVDLSDLAGRGVFSSFPMYYGDHPPPHCHAIYTGKRGTVDIETLAFIEGQFPARAQGLDIEWVTLHQEELRETFRRAAAIQVPAKIALLD